MNRDELIALAERVEVMQENLAQILEDLEEREQ
jgi:hypothetical protein